MVRRGDYGKGDNFSYVSIQVGFGSNQSIISSSKSQILKQLYLEVSLALQSNSFCFGLIDHDAWLQAFLGPSGLALLPACLC